MKSKKIFILGSSFLLAILMGAFYFFVYDNMTVQSLTFIEIEYKAENMYVENEIVEIDPKKYQLSQEEARILLQNLETKEVNKIEDYDFSQIEELEKQKDTAVEPFVLRLINRFGREEDYEIYLTTEKKAYLIINDTLYRVQDHEFFFSHEGFDPYYQTNYLPDIQLDENLVFREKTSAINWKVQRYDGSWLENNSEKTDFFSDANGSYFFDLQNEKEQPKINYKKEPDEIMYTLLNLETNEKTEIEKGSDLEHHLLPIPKTNGNYRYQLQSIWEQGTSSRAEISFELKINLPITFDISERIIEQDDIIEIKADRAATPDDIRVKGELGDDLQWHRDDQKLRTIIATNYHTKPGNYSLELVDVNSDKKHSYDIEIHPRDYKTQHLSINPSVEDRTRNQEAYQEREEYFDPIWESSSDNKYYEDTFVLPTEGRLTTEFGEKRFVNEERTSYRHNGIDIAALQGTDILATNYGEVVFTKGMILMGNTIVIDHGHGILSTYMHLDEIHVEEGEMVAKEELIGTVGSTGFSTGPHLHFTVSYYDKPLEPGYFIIGKPFTKEYHYHLHR
ncbi:M23 family metallopeptidase [Isachenkonia alkalipeptolytica]|uniref:M23 family metallopeptidase n=1 Tax=Isachenkonia alkalipeptolytica TaxID=2565777 RepID=A0AA43XLA8_9CLOT|nr:M23 family metallopeptidase [Isachenkonia alkalipeptolytica]NBG88930.1 M23 family metallopeptidase [Isachenkonia alkalipeptolytica]